MDILTYAISKKVAASAVSGVQSVAVQDTTLLITTNDGNVLPMVFPTPADGVSVVDVDIDANNMLSFILSDGTVLPAGQIDTIKGDKGDKGDPGEKGDKGDTGATGAQGIPGPQGAPGEKGATGATGADGFSPIITTNSNNTEDVYKLDIIDKNGSFTTPNLVGRQGDQGIQGERGETGPEGPPGIQGIQGIKGDKGEDGYPFLIYKEYTDISEFDASHFPEIGLMFMINNGDPDTNRPVYRYTGETANPYSHVTDLTTSEGLKGEKGDKGDTGEQGVPGVAGVDGENGITFTPRIGTVQGVEAMQDAAATVDVDTENKLATYNFWIPRGPAGQQGLPGEKGEPGETGEKGADGTTYVPEIGTIETVDAALTASASVELDNDTHRAKFNFNIPKGVGVAKVEFTSSDMGDVAGLPGATDTYTITFTDGSTSEYSVYNGSDCDIQIDDEGELSETSVWSNQKTSEEIGKKESVYVTDSIANTLYYACEYFGLDCRNQYQTLEVEVVDVKGQNLKFNSVYKHEVLHHAQVISENGITLKAIDILGTLAFDNASDYTIKIKHTGVCPDSVGDTLVTVINRTNKNALASEIIATFLTRDYASGDNEKTFSFKVNKSYFTQYYAKRTFLLSANIYSLGFSKPVIGLLEVFRSSTDAYGGYIANLEDTRYQTVSVAVNGDYLEISVKFNSYEGSGCVVSCSSLSNVPMMS